MKNGRLFLRLLLDFLCLLREVLDNSLQIVLLLLLHGGLLAGAGNLGDHRAGSLHLPHRLQPAHVVSDQVCVVQESHLLLLSQLLNRVDFLAKLSLFLLDQQLSPFFFGSGNFVLFEDHVKEFVLLVQVLELLGELLFL